MEGSQDTDEVESTVKAESAQAKNGKQAKAKMRRPHSLCPRSSLLSLSSLSVCRSLLRLRRAIFKDHSAKFEILTQCADRISVKYSFGLQTGKLPS